MTTEKILGGFRKRNLPLNADYRPMYKIGLIVMILRIVSTGNKSSLSKLHFFIWALKSQRNMEFIQTILNSEDTSQIMSWGVEPALNKALLFGIAEELFILNEDKYALTKKGHDLGKKIEDDKELFIKEKSFLTSTGKKKVTEAFITQLTKKLSS